MSKNRNRSKTIESNPSTSTMDTNTLTGSYRDQLTSITESIRINRRILESQEQQVNKKRNTLVKQNDQISYNDQIIQQQMLKNQEYIHANTHNSTIIQQQVQTILEKYAEIGNYDQQIHEKTKLIEEHNATLKTLEEQIQTYQQQMASYYNTLNAFSLISHNPQYFGQMANMMMILNPGQQQTQPQEQPQ